MQFIKAAPIRVGARPIMIFGMGSHTYPRSRSSVGYYLVDLLGKRLGLNFHRFTSGNAYVAHYEPENLLLVQPDTYLVIDNHQCMRRIAHHYPVDPKKSVLIYHEPSLPLGVVHYATKGRTENNVDLQKIAKELKTEEFPRIAVGIQYPDPSMRFDAPIINQLQTKSGNFDEYFLLNKFPHSHWVQLHEFVVPRVFAAIDKAVGQIREDFPLTTVDEFNPVRAENQFVTDLPDPYEIIVDTAESKKEDDPVARLWAIRRERENDPEFKRLMGLTGNLADKKPV